MKMALVRPMLATCAFVGLATGLAACSSGTDTVSKDDVVSQIEEKLADANPSDVSCPSDLDAKVDATIDCTMTVQGEKYGVNVKVTSVDGDTVKFDMIQTIDKADLAADLSSQLAAQVGAVPEKVTCPENLKGVVGTTLKCMVTDSGESVGVTVTVTDVDGGEVAYEWQVDG